MSLCIRLSRRLTHQQTQGLIGLTHGIDVELAITHCLQHLLVQHQGSHVGLRNDRALLACQPACFAESEEAFDLLVDPTHGLHFAELVDRAGNGKTLLERGF